SRRANSAMLIAQHSDPANVMSTTSGEANPAYDVMTISTLMTDTAGATRLVPNAVTRTRPTTPLASPPVSCLYALTPRSPVQGARPPYRAQDDRLPWACPAQAALDLIQGSYEHGTARTSGWGRAFPGRERAWARLTCVSMSAWHTARAGQHSTWSRRSPAVPWSGPGPSAGRRWSNGWREMTLVRSCRWSRRPATARPHSCRSGLNATIRHLHGCRWTRGTT